MNDVDQATQTQLANLQARSGKSLEELYAIIRASGLSKHGQIRDMLKQNLGMGHGDANTLVHFYLQAEAEAAGSGQPAAGEADVLDAIYSGPKAALRPIHERVMAGIEGFGPFEIAPKKGYLSLRRKKQFAMIGPATQTRLEVGLNMKGVEGGERLLAQPPGGMCQYRVKLASADEVDAELFAWIRQAYDGAG